MASPTQMTEGLPETLPGDFGQWDEEASPSRLAVNLAGHEAGPGGGAALNQAVRPAETHRPVSVLEDLPMGVALSAAAPQHADDAGSADRVQSLTQALIPSRDTVVQRKVVLPAIDEVRFSAPRPSSGMTATTASEAVAKSAADGISAHSLRANTIEPRAAKPWPAKKKWPVIAGPSAALVVILAAAVIPGFNRGRASAKPVAGPTPPMTTQPAENAASKPFPAAPIPATTTGGEVQSRSVPAQALIQKNAGPSQAQAQMMNDQLQAPSRIHAAAALAEQASPPPGGFAAAEIDGSDNHNAIGTVFGGPKDLKVQAAARPVISVSSGAALSLLIQKTPPVYPVIAKTGRVSGTVVLAVTISKGGNVENVRVVTGPAMLRRPAVDAVRTWRFKPYLVDNQPTAIETTINVHFTLDN